MDFNRRFIHIERNSPRIRNWNWNVYGFVCLRKNIKSIQGQGPGGQWLRSYCRDCAMEMDIIFKTEVCHPPCLGLQTSKTQSLQATYTAVLCDESLCSQTISNLTIALICIILRALKSLTERSPKLCPAVRPNPALLMTTSKKAYNVLIERPTNS